MADLAKLTTVMNELAAEEIRSLLRTEGIESIQQKTDFAAGMTDASPSAFGPREIFVYPKDLERARALIAEG